MNPIENMRPLAERRLCDLEEDGDSLDVFADRCVEAVKAHSSAAALITFMPKHMSECVERSDAMIFK